MLAHTTVEISKLAGASHALDLLSGFSILALMHYNGNAPKVKRPLRVTFWGAEILDSLVRVAITVGGILPFIRKGLTVGRYARRCALEISHQSFRA
jgi:hypothetical protein